MSGSQLSANTHSRFTGPGPAAPLARVVYRSRAVRPVSPPELHELTAAAQVRNARESITGLMLYDDSNFFQWLEGPPKGVGRIMRSIRNDGRHTDIDILSQRSAPSRTFGDWSMKLATPGPNSITWQRDVIEPPREIVEDLRARPKAAPALLVKLSPSSARGAATDNLVADQIAALPLHHKTAAILKRVMLSSVIPKLATGHGVQARQAALLPASPRAEELAELLIAADQAAAAELIKELQAEQGPFVNLYATLFEPAARRLGDLWSDDTCSEFDVTLGLCRLQTAVRLLSADTVRPLPSRLKQPIVLIAPEPGELHRLGAALDSDTLWNAGWSPHCEYPTDDKTLQDLVSSTWFDVLDLSLSAAFRREHWLPRITETIAHAREASRNPALMVVVGGRVFLEEQTAGSKVGADLATKTALNVDRSIKESLRLAARPVSGSGNM
jgi:methanogenic corrinoid protein MtbC1